MNKNLFSILTCMLLLATAFSLGGIADENIKSLVDPNGYVGPQDQSRALWDVQLYFDAGTPTGSLYMVGTVFDGTYFYCAEFNSNNMFRFSILAPISTP